MSKAERLVNVVLTKIATGYKNAACIGTKLFPVVPVEKEGNIIPKFGKDAFRLYKTLRAPGGSTNLYKLEDVTTQDVVLQEHDFGVPVDYRTKKESMFNEERRAVFTGRKAIELELEVEIANIAQNASNYSASNKKALTTTACWDQTNGNPIGDIEAAKEAIRTAIGIRPNTMIIGAEAWSVLKNHASIMEKIKYVQKGVATPELVASIFDLDEVVVGDAVYDNKGTMTDIWKDNVILAYVPKQAESYDEPAAGYVLRMEGHPFVDTYEAEGGKVEIVRTTDNYKAALVGADAMYLISNIKK